ncbi:MAG TPA: GrpB family protein, partial [Pirellulales bacterium]
MNSGVIVVPHQATWKDDFQREATHIRAALGEALHAIHHIGSTAIPGIHAKPIIDLLLETPTLAALDARQHAMEKLGYEALGEFGIPDRRYFRKINSSGERTHHVHAFVVGSPGAVRHLAFRDYLLAHPAVAREYDALKLRLVAARPGELDAYIDGKDAFVKDVERDALAWRERPA